MNKKKIKPELLWELYNISINSAHDILEALGFSFYQREGNLILYRNYDEGFILTEDGGVVTKVQYRMKEEATYYDCIGFAKETLLFETIFEKFEPSSDVLRLDDEKCTLIGMIIKTSGNHQSLVITLLAKLPLPTPDNRVEVILQPPPASKTESEI